MRVVRRQDGITTAAVHSKCDLVRHRATRKKQGVLFAKHLRNGVIECVDGWILAKLLIANSVEGLAYERVSVAFFPYTGSGGATLDASGSGVMNAAVVGGEPKRAMSLVLALGAALLGALALTFHTGSRREDRRGRR